MVGSTSGLVATLRQKYLFGILAKPKAKPRMRFRRNLVITDDRPFEALAELARREGTTMSACVQNLVTTFMLTVDSPQTTLDVHGTEAPMPALDADADTWKAYLAGLDADAFRGLDPHVNKLLKAYNDQYDHNMRNGRLPT